MKLNMGCGSKLIAGYVNVDKTGNPDIRHDLEQFPWPWQDNSVTEVRMMHVLEHLGQDLATFRRIMQELYRICSDQAIIHIVVPHPRHDNFLSDPTHVRAVTEETIYLFSKRKNLEYRATGMSNSCLALDWDINFELDDIRYHFDERWQQRIANGQATSDELFEAALDHWNVISMLEMFLKVIKP
jgi:hypothetical protein